VRFDVKRPFDLEAFVVEDDHHPSSCHDAAVKIHHRADAVACDSSDVGGCHGRTGTDHDKSDSRNDNDHCPGGHLGGCRPDHVPRI